MRRVVCFQEEKERNRLSRVEQQEWWDLLLDEMGDDILGPHPRIGDVTNINTTEAEAGVHLTIAEECKRIVDANMRVVMCTQEESERNALSFAEQESWNVIEELGNEILRMHRPTLVNAQTQTTEEVCMVWVVTGLIVSSSCTGNNRNIVV